MQLDIASDAMSYVSLCYIGELNIDRGLNRIRRQFAARYDNPVAMDSVFSMSTYLTHDNQQSPVGDSTVCWLRDGIDYLPLADNLAGMMFSCMVLRYFYRNPIIKMQLCQKLHE